MFSTLPLTGTVFPPSFSRLHRASGFIHFRSAAVYGGSGTIFGMVVGATLIGVINLGMSLMGVDANWQKIVKGGVLLAAVVFDILAAKKNSTK